MAEKIIQNDAGKIWINADNKIIKTRPFSETVIQDGLAFWGAGDPNYLTIINGFVSEAYDIRGTGEKMIQNTVINRLTHTNNYLTQSDIVNSKSLSKSVTNVKSLFVVMKLSINNNRTWGLGINDSNMLGYYLVSNIGLYISPSIKSYYFNDIKKSISSYTTSNIILHSFDNINLNGNIYLGVINQSFPYNDLNPRIYEWGWYNRVLKEQEVLRNVNALNTKYSIF